MSVIIQEQRAQAILNPAKGFIGDYDYTLNPYTGCAFGCGYCYAATFTQNQAPAGAEWGQWTKVKVNAVERIQQEIQAGKLNGASIYMSSVTDPWQPTERKHRISRAILQTLIGVPGLEITLQTRSPLVAEDAGLLRELADRGAQVQLNMTVTTDDDSVRRMVEGTCPANSRRIAALRQVAELETPNLQTCFTLTPLLPLVDPVEFAAQLLETGARRFIIQETHDTQPSASGQLKAVTKDTLVGQLAEIYGCAVEEVDRKYRAEYMENAGKLTREFVRAGAGVGFGRRGFSKPFNGDARWRSPSSWPAFAQAAARPAAAR